MCYVIRDACDSAAYAILHWHSRYMYASHAMRGAMAAVGDARERKGGENEYNAAQVEASTPMCEGDAMLHIRVCKGGG